ncbi:MAG: multiheme c-type cytochrome [Syntrophobacteraceae bacterium]
MPRTGLIVLAACVVLAAASPRSGAQQAANPQKAQPTYVGSLACQSCHPQEYARFKKNSKMSRAYAHVLLMKKGLTEKEYRGCLKCHTTGFGKPGGFVSWKKTPRLAQVGCEACHGPGSIHVASSDPKDIRKVVSVNDCQVCHNNDRVGAFRCSPMLYGGAH